MTETQTYTTNPDGSINIEADGKATKYVKESDLLAVKGASETARREYESTIAKHQADITEANRVRDETHQTLLQERTAKEQLEKDGQEVATLRTKVGELETNLTAGDTTRRQLEEELLGMKRSTFGIKYKVDPEKVKEMSLDQLREAEKNFTAVGFNPANPKPANYDGGPGGAGGISAPLSPIEQAKEELKVARQLQAKMRAGDSDYNP